jgi:hypothetical protein
MTEAHRSDDFGLTLLYWPFDKRTGLMNDRERLFSSGQQHSRSGQMNPFFSEPSLAFLLAIQSLRFDSIGRSFATRRIGPKSVVLGVKVGGRI